MLKSKVYAAHSHYAFQKRATYVVFKPFAIEYMWRKGFKNDLNQFYLGFTRCHNFPEISVVSAVGKTLADV